MQAKALPLSRRLLLQATNNRHGLTLEPQTAGLSQSDVQRLFHVGVPNSVSSPWESASGGVSDVYDDAVLAAVGEAVERYCAATSQVPLRQRKHLATDRIDTDAWCLFTPEQRARADFPFGRAYKDECLYTNAYDLQTNNEVWVPQPLVVLRDDFQTGLSTSSGLAAAPSGSVALLRAIQELIERDALMVTWLHSVPARAVAVPRTMQQEVAALGGEVWVFDLTPKYSPFPVVAVAGGIPKRGKWRYSLGVACRDTWQAAIQKAYVEWNQGVLFAGIYDRHVDTKTVSDPTKLKSFDEHAIYYTLYPEQWHALPMFQEREAIHRPSVRGSKISTEQALRLVKDRLAVYNIRLYYRELTTIDAHGLGVRVVRALSPDMAQIFAHQEWPLLNGVESMLHEKYPWAPRDLTFPNLMPHPLG